MGRGRNGKDSCYVYNSYFLDGIRLSLVQNLKENESLTFDEILNKYNLNKALTWRWKKSIPKGNKIDVDKVNIAKQCDGAEWVEVPQIVIKIITDMINQEMSNKEITNKIKIKLKKEGFEMENNKLVVSENKEVKEIILNIVADLGNNFVKVCVEDKVISFINKIESIADETMLADNEYIKSNDSDKYFIIGNEFSKFEKNPNKKDKKFLPALYYSIARCIKELGIEEEYDEFHINLAVLSPLNQMKFANEYVEKINNDSIWDCECKVDGKKCDLVISIDHAEIFPEGLCAFPMFEDKSNTQVICDIGSQTANIAVIRNGKVSKVITLDDMGSFNYYHELVKSLKDNEVTKDNIQRYIEDGMYEHNIELLTDYYQKLFTDIKREVASKVNKYNVIGGTVELFKENGISPKEGSNVIFHENASIINTLGAMKMLNAKYKVGE